MQSSVCSIFFTFKFQTSFMGSLNEDNEIQKFYFTLRKELAQLICSYSRKQYLNISK